MIVRKFKVPFSSEWCIVDNEISNDITNPIKGADWFYDKADLICCGILDKDEILIFFREKEDDLEHYKNSLRNILDSKGKLYAFNFNMEKGNFKGFLNKSYDVLEIKPFKGKGWSKQKFFEELLNDKKVLEKDCPKDPIEDDSGKCLELYAKGDYETIINHNISDLVKQYAILKHKKYIYSKYASKISSQGFYSG